MGYVNFLEGIFPLYQLFVGKKLDVACQTAQKLELVTGVPIGGNTKHGHKSVVLSKAFKGRPASPHGYAQIPMLASPRACSPCPLPINAMLSIEGLLNLLSWSFNENHNFGWLFLGWWVWAYSIFSELHIQMSMEYIQFARTSIRECYKYGGFDAWEFLFHHELMWMEIVFVMDDEVWQRQKPSYFPLYRLINRDPYNGL